MGDIGGTNCRLVLWKILPGGEDEILFQKVDPLDSAFTLFPPHLIVNSFVQWCRSI